MGRLGCVLLLLGVCGCPAATQAVIEIKLADGAAAPSAIEVHVYDARGTRASKTFGPVALPGKVVLQLERGGESLRVAVAGTPPSTLLGGTTLDTLDAEEIHASVTLAQGTADRDGDRVPDFIDNCPDAPNRGQENDDGAGGGNACGAGDGGLPPDLFGVDGGAHIVALHPEVANTGDTLYIEGRFTPGARVDFPGAAGVMPVEVTAARVAVLVPATAGTGLLRVNNGGLTSNELPFRRASFPVAIQPFRVDEEQTTIARQPVVAERTQGQQAVVANGRVFLFGALIDKRVEAARINADGTLGPFKQVGTLTHNRYRPSVTLIGDQMYVVGGYRNDMSMVVPTVEQAKLHLDGTIDPFVPAAGLSLTTPRRGHVALIVGHWLYAIGGSSSYPSSTELDSIERAEIRADGTLDAFQAGGTMRNKRDGCGAAVVGPWLYVFGGYTGSSYVEEVERALIRDDGTLDAFAPVAVSWTQSRMSFATTAIGNKVYVVGGYKAGARQGDVQMATILPNGTLGPFGAVPGGLSRPRNDHSVAVIENRVYAFSGDAMDTTEHASLIGPAKLSPLSAFIPMGSHATAAVPVVLGRWMYMIGGEDAMNNSVRTIVRAPIAADGTLGSFASTGQTLVSRREGAVGAVIRDTLHVIGGPRADMESATIADDGTLGAFTTHATNMLAKPRGYGWAAVKDSYLYLFGGDGTLGRNVDVERAPIQAAGGLDPFALLTGSAVGDGRPGLSGVMLGSDVYLFGGVDVGGNTNSFGTKTTVMSDGSLSAFSASPGTSRAWFGTAVVGSNVFLSGGVYIRDVRVGPITSAGVLGNFSDAQVDHADERWDHTVVVLGNYFYAVGGIRSNDAIETTIERAEIVP